MQLFWNWLESKELFSIIQQIKLIFLLEVTGLVSFYWDNELLTQLNKFLQDAKHFW